MADNITSFKLAHHITSVIMSYNTYFYELILFNHLVSKLKSLAILQGFLVYKIRIYSS